MINLFSLVENNPAFSRRLIRAARFHKRNLQKKVRYGAKAPLAGELIYVPTRKIKFYDKSRGRRSCSGKITPRDWAPQYMSLRSFPKIQFCWQHWHDGIPWEETGAYERMMKRIAVKGSMDGCRTFDDVVARYNALDRVYETVKRDGCLRSQKELRSQKREDGGILIHIDRFGEPVFGLAGCHRMSMALVLDLAYIPAQIGFVHPDGVQHLYKYRQKPELPTPLFREKPINQAIKLT